MVQNNAITKSIQYFDGVNSLVASNLAKKEELMHGENARSPMIGTIEKREGMSIVGTAAASAPFTATANLGLFYFNNAYNKGLYRISTVAAVNSIYYLNNSDVWTALTGLGTAFTPTDIVSTCMAENDLYIVNQGITSRYIKGTDGTTVVDSTPFGISTVTINTAGTGYHANDILTVVQGSAFGGTIKVSTVDGGGAITAIAVNAVGAGYSVANGLTVTGGYGTTAKINITAISLAQNNLYNCPKASIINYYKGKLYVADYIYGSITYNNTVLMSSTQLGILSLVNNDTAIGQSIIPVTDTKYFINGETVEFRRGNQGIITTGVVASVQETSITLTAVTTVTLNSADEIWIENTYSGKKVFRWVGNPSTMGVNAKTYDTFKISSTTDNDNERINVMTNVGNVMLMATSNNIAIWNNFVLQNLDFGVGCCSRRGHVKAGALLYFLHYTGVYATEGGAPKYISAKVEKYIQGATKTNLDIAVAGKKGRNIFFCIGDVTLRNPDGSVDKIMKDVCLEYSITQENWYVHSNWKLKRAVTYISSDDPDRLVGISTFTDFPVVELLATGKYLDVSSASSINTEIPFRMDTPNILLGNAFQLISYPTEVHVEMERGVGMKCFVSLDMGEWYELEGEAGKGLTIFKVHGKDGNVAKPPRCRNIRLSFRHFGKQLCKISKIAIQSISTPEEEQIKEDGK